MLHGIRPENFPETRSEHGTARCHLVPLAHYAHTIRYNAYERKVILRICTASIMLTGGQLIRYIYWGSAVASKMNQNGQIERK